MFKVQSNLKAALLLGAASALAAGYAIPASAADAVETVVVTGSRIPTKDYASNSPVATVQGDQIRTLGTGTIETYLNTLPQFTPSLTKTNNNPQGGGAATLDLRDLGPSRTLVLVDGRRVIGSTSSVVDVSILPSSLIERVEVVTGGASAVYGSDALAGVVNFILKKDFQGIQFTARGGISAKGDGEEHRFETIIGGNFDGDKGNATMVLTYEKRTGIGEGARAFSANAQACDTGPVVGGPIHCIRNGSPTTPDGTLVSSTVTLTQAAINAYFSAPAHGGLALPTTSTPGQPAVSEIGFNPNGTLFYTSGGGTVFPVTNYQGPNTAFDPSTFTYNFNPTNLLVLPFKRFSIYTTAYYDVMPHVQAYATGLFTNYSSRTQLAPTPATFTVNLGPAFAAGTLPTDLVNLYTASGTVLTAATPGSIRVARRTNELGPRAGNFDNNVFQVTAGLRGDIPGIVDGTTYNYDVFTSYGRYYGDVFFTGYASGSRATAAASGCPAGSPAGPPGVVCTALNIFGNNSITAANANYISEPYYDNALNTLMDVQATLAGDAFSLPAGPVGFAIGTEYRELFFQDVPDVVLQIGDVQGANASAITRGGYNVLEGFGEIKVPVLSDLPFAEYVGLEAGARISKYSSGRTVTTLKAGGEWSPVEEIKFRGMYQHAIRAASVTELFSNAQGGFPSFNNQIDPCGTTSPERTGVARAGGSGQIANAASIAALCALQAPGVTYNSSSLFVYGGSGQIYSVSGGNPALAPETENNWTLGMVIRPGHAWGDFLGHFTATVDYYNLRINGVISTVSAVTSLTRCYDPGFNPTYSAGNAYCAAIHRDPGTGSVSSLTQPIGFVAAQNANLGAWKVAGIDADINYTTELSDLGLDEAWGSLSINDTVAYLDRFKVQVLPGEGFTNIAGTIGDGTPGRSLASHPALPNWKNTLRFTWNVDDFEFGWRLYTLGATDNFHPGPDAPNSAITHVPLLTYHYFNARWNLDNNWSFFGGVDNVMDEQPPRYTAAFQYTIDPSTYDTTGRFFYAGVTVKY